MMKDLLIVNAAEMATPVGKSARRGREMREIKIIKNGSIAVRNGKFLDVGTTGELLSRYNIRDFEVIDAGGKCIVPGFVDSHTHFIFGGYREDEFLMRLEGKGYLEIMEAGGGIVSTVRETRKLSLKEMIEIGLSRLHEMLKNGVTTVEGKSGYGLDLDTELRTLQAIKQLKEKQPIDIAATYLGAHAIPDEYSGRSGEYIDSIIHDILPVIKEQQLAEFCDVFCEKGVFSIKESERLLHSAAQCGMKCKIHADEMESLGGAELASRTGCVSADHLLSASLQGIRQLAESGVVATLLPATAFCLNKPYADGRKMIDSGCAVALASDYNPGSCFSNSIPLLFALACINMKMTPEETLTAITLNGAAAISRAETTGSIEPGKKADFIVLKYPSYKFLVYNTASNLVERVFINGRMVCQN